MPEPRVRASSPARSALGAPRAAARRGPSPARGRASRDPSPAPGRAPRDPPLARGHASRDASRGASRDPSPERGGERRGSSPRPVRKKGRDRDRDSPERSRGGSRPRSRTPSPERERKKGHSRARTPSPERKKGHPRARTPSPERKKEQHGLRDSPERKERAHRRSDPPAHDRGRQEPRAARANDRHWTPEMEAIARRTMRQANGYAWMYENMATSAKHWGDGLNIASGVLGGIVGTAGIISVATESSTPLWARILQIILGFLVTLVSVLTATWRLSETQMNDVLTQVSYATLGKDLMWQLAQPRKDRQDAREYVRAKLGEVEQLKVSAPTISTRTRHAYNNKFKNNPIYTPEDQWDAIIADTPYDRPADQSEDSELSAAAAESVTPGSARLSGSDQSSLEDDLAQAGAEPVATRAEALDPAKLMGALIAAYDAAHSRPDVTVEVGVDSDGDGDDSAPAPTAAPAPTDAAPPHRRKKPKKKVPKDTGGV